MKTHRLHFSGRLLGLAVTLALIAGVVRSAEPERLASFKFLLGEWKGTGGGQPGGSAGGFTFAESLQGRVIIRTSFAEYPASGGKPASRHDDLMIMYVDADSTVKADFYDNEGHVIRYTVRSPANNEAVFVSAPSASAPRYRLAYKLDNAGVLNGEFAIAPPGKPESFSTYLTWKANR